MNSKKFIAGLMAVAVIGAVSPAMADLGLPSVEFGISASAADEHTFTGEIKKIISVGILVTPTAESEEAAVASQFMVKYSDTDAFNVGDKVTITYDCDVSVEKDVATITALSVEVGDNSASAPSEEPTPVADPVETKTETVTETKVEETTKTEKPDVTATEEKTDNSKPATTTPATGEGSFMAIIGTLTATAAVVSKKFANK